MSESNPVTEGIKAAGQIVPDVYKDAVQPAAQASGHALGTLMNVFNLLLAPLERAQIRSQDKTDRLRQKLAEGFEEIPPERRVEPPLEVVGPALEKLKYVTDKELQDMFVGLLLSSMDSDRQAATHPAFVRVIDELSPFDAWMLRQIYAMNFSFAIRHIESEDFMIGDKGGYRLSSYIPCGIIQQGDTSVFDKSRQSMENLVRLGLINLALDDSDKQMLKTLLSGNNVFVMGDDYAFIKSINNMNELLHFYGIKNISLSVLGYDFCRTCIPNS